MLQRRHCQSLGHGPACPEDGDQAPAGQTRPGAGHGSLLWKHGPCGGCRPHGWHHPALGCQRWVVRWTATPGGRSCDLPQHSVSLGRLGSCGNDSFSLDETLCTGKFGRSAAIEQVAVPSQQMVARQDWNYVSSAHKIIRSAHVAGTKLGCVLCGVQGDKLWWHGRGLHGLWCLSQGSADHGDLDFSVWHISRIGTTLQAARSLAWLFQEMDISLSLGAGTTR